MKLVSFIQVMDSHQILQKIDDPLLGIPLFQHGFHFDPATKALVINLPYICKKSEKEILEKITVDHQEAFSDISFRFQSHQSPFLSEHFPAVKNLISIGSGKGGVGKSTVTANLAVSLSKLGAKVGILDADIYGPSVPLLFGLEGKSPDVKKINERDFMLPLEKYGVKLMSLGFLVGSDQAAIWRGPMATKAIQQILFETDWGELDYLLFDLPPGTGDVHLSLVQMVPITGAVVVTTPQKLSFPDVCKSIDFFGNKNVNVPVLGVVENMSYFSPSDAPDKKYFIFGKDFSKKLAQKYDLEVLSQVPFSEETDQGDQDNLILMNEKTEAVFSQLASELTKKIALRNTRKKPTSVVQIKRK